MTTERDRIQARAQAQAEQVAKTTRIDLDSFLALKGEDRAARWRMWDRAAKVDAIIQQLGRGGFDWNEATIEHWIAKYDAKFAATATELATEAALERLATEQANHARTARAAGEKADAGYYQRAATSYTNALIEYRRGVRPQRLNSGAWLLPSRRAGEQPHMVGADHVCSCRAGEAMHWPIALIIGIEVALEDMSNHDDPAELAPQVEQLASLGRRLACARARILEVA